MPVTADGVGSKIYIHRGLCGTSLKVQCMFIGGTYLLISMLSVIVASVMLHNPVQYVNLSTLAVDSTKEGLNGTEVDSESRESTMDELNRMTEDTLHDVGANGIELLVEGLSTLVVSALLIHGIKQEKTTFIFPWVVVTILLTVTNFLTFMVKVASPDSVTIAKVFAAIFYFMMTLYFILSVYSYYQILRIRKKKVITFLDHEFQGGEGSWYHTLEESGGDDIAPTHTYSGPSPPYSGILGAPYSDVPPQYTGNNPFRRPQPPFTEKAVPMTEEEDYAKENVLFAKI